MERKTINYYREALKKNVTESLIAEVATKYGDGHIRVKGEFHWNHRIEGFGVTKDGKVYVDIYWQGDSTDGNDTIRLADFKCRNEVVIPASSYFDGYRTRYDHSDIRVSRAEVEEAIAFISEWLSPDAVKARKDALLKREIEGKRSKIVGNELYDKFASRWGGNDKYYNGSSKTREYVAENYKELAKLNDTEFHDAIVKVFLEGYKA